MFSTEQEYPLFTFVLMKKPYLHHWIRRGYACIAIIAIGIGIASEMKFRAGLKNLTEESQKRSPLSATLETVAKFPKVEEHRTIANWSFAFGAVMVLIVLLTTSRSSSHAVKRRPS